MTRGLPGPVGDDAGAFNYRLWQADAFTFLSDLARAYGDVVGFHLGDSACVLVNGAPEVRELLKRQETHLCKPEFVSESHRADWGDGLTSLEAESWRRRRQALRPCFTSAMVSAAAVSVTQCTTQMLDTWRNDAVLDLRQELRLLVARIALRTVLDADIEGMPDCHERSGLVSRTQALGEDRRSIDGGDPSAPLWQVRPRAPSNMDAIVCIVDERLCSGETRGDLLSLLLAGRETTEPGWGREALIGEIMQMLYAGHLTIPASLMAFWREVSNHVGREILLAEARRFSSASCGDAVARHGPHCLAMLKESLRLHPPAPLLFREVTSAFELRGHALDRQMLVLVSPQLLHRDSRYFAQPEQFIPARFLGNDKDPMATQSQGGKPLQAVSGSAAPYLPFGMGPRSCIASHLAMQQMARIILLVADRFIVQPVRGDSTRFIVQARH
ncbi:cytochrome P450 [Granulosicoccus sp. 3-233]|uniref:cytochrome P450 n=1 Tax=Granulosicoccus sp. 3-233 TaxID=3417969 RepID=UPI003D355A24